MAVEPILVEAAEVMLVVECGPVADSMAAVVVSVLAVVVCAISAAEDAASARDRMLLVLRCRVRTYHVQWRNRAFMVADP